VRPFFLKAVAAFPAAPKVALASSAVIATVVSMSDRLPPAAAASMAEAAAFVREFANHQPVMGAERQIPTHEPSSNTLEKLGEGFLTIFGFSQ
jgi:hypothetical protein